MISITMIPAPFDLLPPASLIHETAPKGAIVFRQGDQAKGPYFVLSGAVQMIRHNETGQQITLHRAGADQTLAEASLFSDHYHCDCVASEDSRLICFRKEDTLRAIRNNHEFMFALLRLMARQVQSYRRLLEIQSIKSAEGRVFAALAELGQTGTVIEFSSQIGLTHEATYRALSHLVAQNRVIRIGRGRYAINRPMRMT